jgi:hypothetical protein
MFRTLSQPAALLLVAAAGMIASCALCSDPTLYSWNDLTRRGTGFGRGDSLQYTSASRCSLGRRMGVNRLLGRLARDEWV